MHFRSWMAAVVLVAGSMVLLSGMARSQKTGSEQSPSAAGKASAEAPKTQSNQSSPDARKRPGTNGQVVKLTVMIAGLSDGGCDVEVKPGNQSTRFKPQRLHVDARGEAKFEIQGIEIRGADRNCTFAITAHESGQGPKTIYRGFRIASRPASTSPAPSIQSFTCFMNSPSKLAGLEPANQTRR